MSTQFDLEQQILQCWNVTEDLKLLCTSVLESEVPMTHDHIANILLGMEQLYDLKFNRLFDTFEKYLKENYIRSQS